MRDLMRSGMSDDEIVGAISGVVKRKKYSHDGMEQIAKQKNRPMVLIGG